MKHWWPKAAAAVAILLIVGGWAHEASAQRQSGSSRSFGPQRTSNSSRTSSSTTAAPNSSAKPLELLNQRNIFDPTRMPIRVRPQETPRPRPDTLALVGVFISNGHQLAIFEGNVVGHQGSFTEGDTVAGLKILSVDTEHVKLQDGNRTVDLPMGSALSRRPNEAWNLASGGGTVTSASDDTDSSTGVTSGTAVAPPPAPAGMSDVVKRMMERRQKASGQKETK